MQVGGSGLRMDFWHFEQIFLDNVTLHRAVLRLVQHEALVLGHLSACNRLHEVEGRPAR
jgi:hypothetical protein